MHPYCYPCSYRLHRSRPPAQLPRHHLEVGAALPTLRGEGDFVAFLPGSGKRNLSPGGGTSRWDPLSHHQCKLPRCLWDPPLHVFPSFLRDPDPSLFMLGTPQALDNPYLLRHNRGFVGCADRLSLFVFLFFGERNHTKLRRCSLRPHGLLP